MTFKLRCQIVVLLLLLLGCLQAQAWTALPDMQRARVEATAVLYENDIYVFNGFGPNIRIEPSVEKYDSATEQWSVIGSTSAVLGNAVTHNGVVKVGHKVWIIGGRIGSHPGRVTDNVWIYDLRDGGWERGPALPIPGAAGGAALVGNTIHWFGGVDTLARCDVDSHYTLNVNDASSGWSDITDVAAMPNPRNHFSTVVIDEKIYAIGGQFGHDRCTDYTTGDTKLVHVFDPSNNSWQRLADLPDIQSHNEPATFAHAGYVFSVGGRRNHDQVMRYNPASDEWVQILTLPQRLLAPVARIIDGELIVGGGGAPRAIDAVGTTHRIALAVPNNGPSETPEASDGGNDNVDVSVDNTAASGNYLLSVEAEDFDVRTATNTHRWVNASIGGSSSAGSMISTPDSGAVARQSANSPMMSYSLNFPGPGTHYVWIRGLGDSNDRGEGKSDSLHVGLNGSLAASADKIDRFPSGDWHWSQSTRDGPSATLNVPTAGQHTVNIWMREDGLAIDKFLITNDASFVPVGIAPEGSVNGSENMGSETAAEPEPEPEPEDNTETPVESDDSDNTVADTAGTTPDTGPEMPDSTADAANAIGYPIAVEAEDFDLRSSTDTHQWESSFSVDSSAGQSMVSSPNVGKVSRGSVGSPMLSYLLYFAEPGKHYVWVRGSGDTNARGEGKNDSLHVGLNNVLSTTADKMDNFPQGDWHWSNSTRDGAPASLIVPTSGFHNVNIWMREDGLAVDKFVITKDANFEPSGDGPIENAGGTDVSDVDTTSVVSTGNSTTPPVVTVAPVSASRAWGFQQTSNGSAVTARHEAGAVTVNGKIYVMGGRGNRPVESFDPVTKRWTDHGRPPVNFHHYQPVAIGNMIYVVTALAGNIPNEVPLEHVYRFNTENHTWAQLTSIPVGRARGAAGAVAYNGKIYVVGGNLNGHLGPSVAWFDEFDPVNNAWNVLTSSPNARDHATIAVANGKLVVAAGRETDLPNLFDRVVTATDLYNFSTGQWEPGQADIPTRRAGTMTVSHGSEVIVIGGESMAMREGHDDVEAYNVETRIWRTLQGLNQGRHSGGATVLDDEIHVISGNLVRGGGDETTSHEVLDLNP